MYEQYIVYFTSNFDRRIIVVLTISKQSTKKYVM